MKFPCPEAAPITAPLLLDQNTELSATPEIRVELPDDLLGERFDLRYNLTSPDPAAAGWVDNQSSSVITASPFTFPAYTGIASSGQTVYFGLYRFIGPDPTTDWVQVATGEYTMPDTTPSDVVASQINRLFFNADKPATFDDLYGAASVNDALIEYPNPNGGRLQVDLPQSAVAGETNDTASTVAEVLSRLPNIGPNGGRLTLQNNISLSGQTIPASITGSAGNYRVMDLNGFNIGSGGGIVTVSADNLALVNGSSDSIVQLTGNDNIAYNVEIVAAEIRLFAANGQPRPTDNKVIKCNFLADPSSDARPGVNLSTSSVPSANVPLRFVVHGNTFTGFVDNAIAGTGVRATYPTTENNTYGIITGNLFSNCSGELLTVKEDAVFVWGNKADGPGHFSLRQTHESVFSGNLFMGDPAFWFQAFGYDHIISDNIAIVDQAGFIPLSIENPQSTTLSNGDIDHNRMALARSIIERNLFISNSGNNFRGWLVGKQGFGAARHQLWIDNQEGLDVVQNVWRDNIYLGNTATVPAYRDDTNTSRLPESFITANNDADRASQVAIQQDPANRLTHPALATPITFPGSTVYPGRWENGSDLVVEQHPRLADGSLFNIL